MSASFRKIDYSLRPAKHTERRMLCEVFRKLRPFQPVEDYVYIGMGAMWFSDFALFHRMLGIRSMISIERVVGDTTPRGVKARIEANKPFAAIRMDFRETTQALPRLDWTTRQFVWLDYDDPISSNILLDAKTIGARARSGSVFAVSVQCQQARELDDVEDGKAGAALEKFRNVFGRNRVPQDVWEDDLVGWRFAALSRKMILSEIEEALATRNAGLAEQDQLRFHSICNFEYSDAAKMTTVVGIFVSNAETSTYEECRFGLLDFLPKVGNLVKIKIPILTVREIRRLEQQLPKVDGKSWDLAAIPLKEAKAFGKLYRYLPSFAILEH